MNKELKSRIKRFYMKHGRGRAEMLLIDYGISKSLAQKILSDNYPSQPRGLCLRAINHALETK